MILSYFSILKHEVLENRTQMDSEQKVYNIYSKLEKIIYEFKIFAHHIQIETKNNIMFEFLHKDSIHYKRCRKAIKENIPISFLTSNGLDNINVVRVVKLQHVKLAQQLQNVSSTALKHQNGGKVKGLFCMVPQSNIYALCAYGLYGQTTTTQFPYQSEVLIPGLFQSAWFSLPPPPPSMPPAIPPSASLDRYKPNHNPNPTISSEGKNVDPNTNDNNIYNNMHSSTKKMKSPQEDSHPRQKYISHTNKSNLDTSTQSSSNLLIQSSTNMGWNTAGIGGVRDSGRAKLMADTQLGFAPLRFSRSCVTSALEQLSQEELRFGVFIALCRVCVHDVYQISGAITDNDVAYGLSHSYSIIYSSSQ